MPEKIVGIMGGMGPEATIDLFAKIVRATKAKQDEDHLRIIIDNNPKMPSRLEAILAGGPSPVPAMVATARNLQQAGADFLVIAANTAHWFHAAVQAEISIPVLHMIDETVTWTREKLPQVKVVGLLATTGTVNTSMYHQAYKKAGIRVLAPDPTEQDQIMNLIFAFKYGEPAKSVQARLVPLAQNLLQAGAQALVMGCTEVPIILDGYVFSMPLIDSNQVMAEVVVKMAKG